MATIWGYLRAHPWQRRLLTASAVLCAAGIAAIALKPVFERRTVLGQLQQAQGDVLFAAVQQAYEFGLDSPSFRRDVAEILPDVPPENFEASMHLLMALARQHPETLEAIEDQFAEMDDRRFQQAAFLLQSKDLWGDAHFDGRVVDRLRRLRFRAEGVSADPRALMALRVDILSRSLLTVRDNPHVRDIADQALADPSPDVRSAGTMLAGRLGMIDPLIELLSDTDETVAAGAAMTLGAENVTRAGQALAEQLRTTEHPRKLLACAWALGHLDAQRWDELFARRLGQVQPEKRKWLLAAAEEYRTRTVRDALEQLLPAEGLPTAALLSAASRVSAPSAGSAAAEVLRAAGDGRAVSMGQLVAALEAVTRLGYPARREVLRIVRSLWGPHMGFMLYRAAEALGVQADIREGQAPDAPSPEECIDTLRRVAMWMRTVRRQHKPVDLRTPVASAMAAATAWLLRPDDTWYRPASGEASLLVEVDRDSTAWAAVNVARLEAPIAADVLAWRIGTSGLDQAIAFGLRLLPDRDDPQPMAAVHDPNQLACGAMMASLAARAGDAAMRQRVIDRIESRMHTRFGLISYAPLLATCRAALVILGRDEYEVSVLQAAKIGQIPARRALTALTAAGTRRGLDWLLIDGQPEAARIERILLTDEFNDVLADLVPDLPGPWAALDSQLRRAQIDLMRRVWLVRRSGPDWSR